MTTLSIALSVVILILIWQLMRYRQNGSRQQAEIVKQQAEIATQQTEIATQKAEIATQQAEIATQQTEIAKLQERQQSWEEKTEQARQAAAERMAIVKENAEKRVEDLKQQASQEKQSLTESFKQQLQLVREQMRSQFEEEMAQRTQALKKEAEERMEMMRHANDEQMKQVVNPLKEELEHLRTLVKNSHETQLQSSAALKESIQTLAAHDQERDKTTKSLADALKNRGKVQGDWGEMVLENILRDSGLREGEEYRKQVSTKGEDGRNDRPDVVVYSSDHKAIIIDSKVSLTAYSDYVGAEDDDQRTAAIRANHDSIWKHVCELSDKNYQKTVEDALPIVLMFVPNEGSYILAMNKDPQLGMKAYQKGVLIINPTNLMVVLRLMFLTWQNVRVDKNNRKILEAAAKIFDKYTVFAKNFVQLGNQLNTARSTYDDARNQLCEGRGNLSKQMKELLELGVVPTKQLPKEAEPLDME